ncbi:hypothetical protein [Flagellimonas sp.]|uniref:hypothetical protein n=1 Tax=Flagellimonas sp. TaxID=2058762 RepID=UPI003B50C9D9
MNKLRILLGILFMLFVTSSQACRYTIREIGFSTLSRVTYVIYKVDETTSFFPRQQAEAFAEANVKPLTLGFNEDAGNPIISFVKSEELKLPAYVLVDQNNRMLALPANQSNGTLQEEILFSPLQKKIASELPNIYATVVLVEGINPHENKIARDLVSKACTRIENIIPNMPKQVEIGPNMAVISKANFEEEKILLWSLGIESIPAQPTAYILYGRGRIMGDKIDYNSIKQENIYKLLSIIGADCECGLDRKWMLGYQIPLNWPKEVGQHLSDNLGFDVDNPMILAEMSRILAIENRVPKDPNNVTFEPLVLNLDDEFGKVPEIEHTVSASGTDDEFTVGQTITYTIIFFLLTSIIGVIFVLKRKK